MIRSRRDLAKLTGLLAATVVLGAACVKPGAPDVAISKIEAQLVFGVPEEKPAISPVSPVIQQVVAEPPEIAAAPEPPPLEFKPFTGQKFEGPPLFVKSSCPAAPEGAAAKLVAEPFIQNKAETGRYRWNIKFRLPHPITGEMQDRTGRFDRIIRNYHEVSDGIFEYEMIEPAGDAVQISTYEVHTKDLVVDPTPPVQGLVQSPVLVGTPERGVVLKSFRFEDEQGNPLPGGFNPRDGLLLLPIPVEPGEHYQSVAVDARGTTYVQDAVVQNVVRIDACGEVIDGWLVNSTRTVTNGSQDGSDQYQYNYVIAPQYGGLVIQEEYVFSPSDPPEELKPVVGDVASTDPIRLTFTIGQVTPRPIPTETG